MDVHSDIDGLSFAAMKTVMIHRSDQFGLTVVENTPATLVVETDLGQFGVSDRSPDGLRLIVRSDRAENLHVLRDSLVGQIAEVLPQKMEEIVWSDTLAPDNYPPNMQFAEVVSSVQLCAEFQRVTLALERPDAYDDTAIHFRILLPTPENTDPIWPTLAPNGSTKWPKGELALHRPVYTARSCRGNLVEMDVFQHEGGRASDWARDVQPGAQLTIIGPGGGGVVDHAPVVLAGDETAYPAIARIIDTLPDDAKGRVVLLSHNGHKDYPFPDNHNLDVIWTDAKGFVAATQKALQEVQDCYAWVAAERTKTGKITALDELKAVPKSQRYVAGYWTSFKFEL